MMWVSSALTKALKLADWGLPVFPVSASKCPTCPHGFKDATRRPNDVRALWRDHPGPLIGVPTGSASGLFILDVDSAKHPSAEEWLERHSPYLPDTRHHRTRSGGLHLLFKHLEGLRNTAGRLALGVDTRGEGGYMIWWPAVIEYGDHKAPLADVPEWMITALEPPDPVVVQMPQRPLTARCAHTKIQGIVGAIAAARNGERNAVLFWGANRLKELAEQSIISIDDAIALAVEAGRQAGLSHVEARRTVNSAFRRQA
jgi:bifunctional DNA primase/polymerase-like protein